MSRRVCWIIVLSVALITVSAAYADDKQLTSRQWLENMNHALKALNFQGTVVLLKNGQLETMKYRHGVVNGIEEEWLSSLNSPLREVTRKANEVSCYFKETAQKVINHHPIDSSFIINLPQDLTQIETIYTLSMAGNESVALLPTQIINIQAKDPFRYNRKVWIETQYFLPLKAEVYSQDGAVLEQLVFTEIKVDGGNQPAAEIADNKTIQVKHIHASEAEPYEQAPFMLKNWPSGFKTVFFIRNSMQQSQKAVDHLLISDGFSSVSVYLEPKEAEGIEGLHSFGSVNSFSRVQNTYQITVLGEVPARTVEFIAAGVTLR
ncbi:MAG: MucB/RseB C-terminal domain-containing protein [Methylomonas sp.]